MLLFHCTQAAGNALKKKTGATTEDWLSVDGPVDDAWVWQLHAVRIGRKLVFVVMQRETRFAMTFWGLKDRDGEALLPLFFERLTKHLLRLAHDSTAVDAEAALAMIDRLMRRHYSVGYRAQSDRSVQTHLNEVVHLCRFAVEELGGLPDNGSAAAGFDRHVNEMLRSIRGGPYFQPDEALLLLCLEAYGEFGTAGLQHVRDSFKALHLRSPLAIQARGEPV